MRLPPLSSSGAADAALELAVGASSPTQSLDRAMELLDCVVANAVQGTSLGALANSVGLKKPTAHRLLCGLRNAGLVDYDMPARLFFPAFKLHHMGQVTGARFDVVQVAGPSLEHLAQQTGDTVYLVIRSGDFAVCAARSLGAFPIKTLTLSVGDIRPLGLGSNGIVLLAAQPEMECERIAARHLKALSEYPAFRPVAMHSHIDFARRNGYAVNQGFMLQEMAAVAMGIRAPNGSVDASISVAAITSRMESPRIDSIVALLRSEIAAIELGMGTHSSTRRVA
jgi:DNA-binding IclR family transcriptional regulator